MIAGVVLAAGRSSRLGRPKQLVPLEGEPLIRHTIRAILRSSLDRVIVVAGHEALAVHAALADLPVAVVVNPNYALGQSTSLRCGVDALPAETEAAVFLLGDQPRVRAETIDALVQAWRQTGAPVVAPLYRDGIGNPVLFARSVFPELRAVEGDTGAKPVVQGHRRAGDLHLAPVDAPAPCDLDTEADYAALLEALDR
ncbi:MAG: nucleotidyltransferase family protein [Thermomicrobiales bacterium]